MVQKRVFFTSSILVCFLVFFSGIIRRDVPEENYLRLAAKKQFNCVGKVFKDTTFRASCVLIGNRFVLSAAHVFVESDKHPETIDMNGTKITVLNHVNERLIDVGKISLEFMGQRVKAKKITLHPAYLDSLTKHSCDIAVIELEKPVQNITPAIINRNFDELNAEVVGVGYGSSGIADNPESVKNYRKKIAGQNVIDSIGGQKYLGHETMLIADFDHPTRKDCNKMGSPVPQPLEYCPSAGDSGGGLFRKNKKNWELIGVFSGTVIYFPQSRDLGYYGNTMEWTRVSAFSKWIDEQIK
jgi:secreted trypsin-like serine protease